MAAGTDAGAGADTGAGITLKRLAFQIAAGVVVLGLVITMINLGLWQLRRHDDRLALRDRLADSLAQPALNMATLDTAAPASPVASPAGTPPASPDPVRAADLEYRRIDAQGELWCSQAVLVRNRSLNGRPGYWAMAPLVLTSAGSDDNPIAEAPAVMVNLGWLPRELASDDICAPTDPDGPTRTSLTGLILLPRSGGKQECDSLAPVCTFAQPDIAAMSDHFSEVQPSAPDLSDDQLSAAQPSATQTLSVAPHFYIQLESSTPPAAPQLLVLGAPEFSLGNHRSYAVQWFIFATIAAGGYPLMLWRNARRRQNQTPPAPDPQS